MAPQTGQVIGKGVHVKDCIMIAPYRTARDCQRAHAVFTHVAEGHGLRFVPQTALGLLARALFGLIQFALFGLLTAILALKRPNLTLDLWVRRSPHEIGLSPAMWAGDWFNVGFLSRGGFFPRFNQFCHPGLTRRL